MELLQTVKINKDDWGFWIKVNEPVWYAISSYAEKDIVKAAGFSWNPEKKLWWTGDRDKAAKLADYAEEAIKDTLLDRKKQMETALAGSRQSVSYADIPHPEDKDYFPFQKAGVEYLSARKNTLLADDMGLGKTIQCIGLMNASITIQTVLIICPATLKLNWKRELEAWLIRYLGDIQVVNSDTTEITGSIVITNFEAMKKHNAALSARQWSLLVVDEAHYLKNAKTIRYTSIMGNETYKEVKADRKVFATGTPICNRPAELWPILTVLDPDRWNKKTFWFYHKRYCGAERGAYGTNLKGAGTEDKLNELQQKLRETIMIRRLKADVLTELPPKMRQVVELEYDEDDEAVRLALRAETKYEELSGEDLEQAQAEAELAKASDNDDEYKKAIAKLVQTVKVGFSEMAKVRHDTAVAKIPYAIEYLKEQLQTIGKIIVFAHHHEALLAVEKAFAGESILIYGGTKIEDRQGLVDKFQNDPDTKVAVVSIQAGGVGITLTAASHVFFLELDWVPGNVTQAEDRAHRIGQRDVVNVTHLVLRDSLDVKMAKTIIAKQKVIEAALDKMEAEVPITPTREAAATHSSTRKQIAEDAEKLDVDTISAIHECLKILEGTDTDYARAINGVGFSKIDVRIGHDLAERGYLSPKQAALGKRIVKKYRKQIPESIYTQIFGEANVAEKSAGDY